MKTINKKKTIQDVIFCLRYYGNFDKRRSCVKDFIELGFSKLDAISMNRKHIYRRDIKNSGISIPFERKINFLKMIKECKFDINANSSRYNCTGIDWKAFHRPSSNGKGWVLIAPDEPANNWYMEDKLILKLLTKKYMTNENLHQRIGTNL